MSVRPKRVPRLWCARLGLLPFDVVLPSETASGAWGDMRLPESAPLSKDVPVAPFRPGEEPGHGPVSRVDRLAFGESVGLRDDCGREQARGQHECRETRERE